MSKANPDLPPATDYGSKEIAPGVHEDFKSVLVVIKGTCDLGRWPKEGEHALLAVQGQLRWKDDERVNGILVHKFTLEADIVAEPAGDLADEASAFLVQVEDERAMRQPLEFPEDETPPGVDPDTGEVTGEEPTDG